MELCTAFLGKNVELVPIRFLVLSLDDPCEINQEEECNHWRQEVNYGPQESKVASNSNDYLIKSNRLDVEYLSLFGIVEINRSFENPIILDDDRLIDRSGFRRIQNRKIVSLKFKICFVFECVLIWPKFVKKTLAFHILFD